MWALLMITLFPYGDTTSQKIGEFYTEVRCLEIVQAFRQSVTPDNGNILYSCMRIPEEK